MAAPATLCRELRRLRDHGRTFDEAWPQALEVAIRVDCNAGDWLAALTATRPGWEAAYDRELSLRSDIAAAGLNGRTEGASTAELPCGVLVA